MTKLIFGCGYVGIRVAQRWLERGETVVAVTRKPARAAEFEKLGMIPVLGDVAQPVQLPPLDDLETVLYAVGFDRRAGNSIGEIYVNGLARALAALPADVSRLIYLSSTGVYGQSAGELIDEDSPCQPQREGGRAVLAAEQQLAHDRLGARAVVLRLAGIYGPGRVPKLHDVQQGLPLAVDQDALLNLIHVDDVVAAILAAETCQSLPARYLVSDGCPVRRGDFYNELARQLQVPAPRFVAPGEQTPGAQRGTSSKRVQNTRMMTNLLKELKYPSYREGLASIHGSIRQ